MVRSCYYSTWSLPGAEGTLIQGRYCFAAPGTPLFPGEIFVCSRNWVTEELDYSPSPYGEQFPPGLNGKRPYFKGRCADPWGQGVPTEVEAGDMPLMGGGEGEGGDLPRANQLIGGEAEGGDLVSLNVTVYGGEAESGVLQRIVVFTGGEAEGGELIVSTFLLSGGEAEGGTTIVPTVAYGGEAEAGDLAGGDLAGGEAEAGDLTPLVLYGGEAEAGDMVELFVIGGEAEAGVLTPNGTNVGGEAEAGDLVVTYPIEGGEAEAGDLALFPTTVMEGGEAEGYYDLTSLFSPDLWLDSRQIISSQGNPVALWPDLSGNGNNFTQGNPGTQPTFDPVGSGRLNGIHFGAGAFMSATSQVLTGSAATVYAVVNVDTTIANIGAVLGWHAGFRTYPGVTNDPFTGGALNAGNSGVFLGVSPWTWFSKPALIAFRHNSVAAWLGGDTPAQGGTFNPSFPGILPCDQLGGFGWFGGFRGWIFEVLVYERAVSDEEDYLISWYLMTKWQTPPF